MPARVNLVTECARIIRLRIIEGEWQTMLPGERTIAKRLEVGRDTVRLALQLLELDQVLSAPTAGRKRLIQLDANHHNTKKQHILRIGMLSPRRLEQLSQPMLFEVDHLRRTLATHEGSLELFSPAWYEQKNPEKRLAQLIIDEPCDAWILFRASASIQRWFKDSGAPCLIRGYPLPDIELPTLDVNWEATARHAAGRLWRLGHRKIGILTPPEALEGVKAAVRGAGDLGETGVELLEIAENGTAAGVAHSLSRTFKLAGPPSALIATRPRQAASAITWLSTQGIRVPEKVSVISLAFEPFLDHLLPAVSGYKVDPAAVSKQVIRRIESLVAGTPNRNIYSWITPEVINGASIAAAG